MKQATPYSIEPTNHAKRQVDPLLLEERLPLEKTLSLEETVSLNVFDERLVVLAAKLMTKIKTESETITSIETQGGDKNKDWQCSSDKPNCNSESSEQFDNEEEEEHEADTLLADPELAEPPLYAVIMYNDNYTPMDFVVWILMSEFKHSQDEAMEIMLNIHEQGKGVAGIYTKDIAETKAVKVNSTSQQEGYPLMTQIEPCK